MFNFLFRKQQKPPKADETAKISVPTAETAQNLEEPAPTPAEMQVSSDDLTIIAVIAAAVAAASGQDPSAFRVVSFKRANKNFSYGK